MTHLQERWEGVSLPGDYLLAQWLSGDDAEGFFETAPMSDGRRALVKVVTDSTGTASAQLSLWQRMRELRHPHLREVVDCGRAELADEIVLYAVFEPADDTLASALANGKLSEVEAREVLEAMLDATRYLRSQGLSHGVVSPEQVIAVGDQIKLSTEGLRETQPDAAASPLAEGLRAFWYKISPSGVMRSADIFSQVVGAEGLASVAPTAPASPVAPTPVTPPPVEPLRSGQLEIAEHAPREVEAAPVHEAPAPAESTATPFRFPKWIAVGAGGVVLLILGLNFLRSPESPAPTATQPVAITPPAPSAATPPSTRPGIAAKKPAPAVPAAKPAAAPAGKAMWRVIAFTYHTRAQATHKVEQLNRAHPKLAASVFTPREKAGYFLVALGGRMTRDEAVRIQRLARAEGVAHDAYIQNYQE